MIGRRKWQGWLVAGVNSGVICVIGMRTQQTGFIPANVFCLALYACNVYQWRFSGKKQIGISQPAQVAQVSPFVTERAETESPAALARRDRGHRARRSAVDPRPMPTRRARVARSH